MELTYRQEGDYLLRTSKHRRARRSEVWNAAASVFQREPERSQRMQMSGELNRT